MAKRTRSVLVRMSEQERASIARAAQSAGLRVADYVRLALTLAITRGISIDPENQRTAA